MHRGNARVSYPSAGRGLEDGRALVPSFAVDEHSRSSRGLDHTEGSLLLASTVDRCELSANGSALGFPGVEGQTTAAIFHEGEGFPARGHCEQKQK